MTPIQSRKVLVGGIALALAVAFAGGYVIRRAGAAGIPQMAPLTYSGVLTDGNGVPLTGSKFIQLQLYTAATGGTPLCTSTGTAAVPLVAGAFQVALPDTCTSFVHANPDLYIDVQVDGAPIGRAKLGAVPYAVEADHAVTATSATSATTATTAATATAIAAGPIAGNLTVITVAGTSLGPTCAIAGGVGAVVDCTCPAGTFITSGGGDAGQGLQRFMRESRAISSTAWRVTCETAAGADVLCVTYHILCSRIGP